MTDEGLEIQGRRLLLILYPGGDAVVEVAFDDSWTLGKGYLGRFNPKTWEVEEVALSAEHRRELGQVLAFAKQSPDVLEFVATRVLGSDSEAPPSRRAE
jgi:hypothetical protein